jgi:putative transposase
MDMKAGRFTEAQIIGVLREQEAGAKTSDVCRIHGISSATFYKWKAKYGGLEVSEAVGRGDARQRHAEGCCIKKIVTPAARREAVAHLQVAYEVSERRACSALVTLPHGLNPV